MKKKSSKSNPPITTIDPVATAMAGTTSDYVDEAAPGFADISQRAREIWQARGCPIGVDDEIWYEAERRLREERRSVMPPLGRRGITVRDSEPRLSERVEEALSHVGPIGSQRSPTALH